MSETEFSGVKRCAVCDTQYSAYEAECYLCGDVNGILLPASLFRQELAVQPITVEPAQPPVMVAEPRKPWSKRGR